MTFRQKALGPRRPFGTRYSSNQTSPRVGERATRGSGSNGRRCKRTNTEGSPGGLLRRPCRAGFLAGGGAGRVAGHRGDEQLPQSGGVRVGVGHTPPRKKMALRVWKRVENRHWRSHSSLRRPWELRRGTTCPPGKAVGGGPPLGPGAHAWRLRLWALTLRPTCGGQTHAQGCWGVGSPAGSRQVSLPEAGIGLGMVLRIRRGLSRSLRRGADSSRRAERQLVGVGTALPPSGVRSDRPRRAGVLARPIRCHGGRSLPLSSSS